MKSLTANGCERTNPSTSLDIWVLMIGTTLFQQVFQRSFFWYADTYSCNASVSVRLFFWLLEKETKHFRLNVFSSLKGLFLIVNDAIPADSPLGSGMRTGEEFMASLTSNGTSLLV